jgi:hypothetical protein
MAGAVEPPLDHFVGGFGTVGNVLSDQLLEVADCADTDNLTGGAGPKERSPQRVPRARTSLTSCSARAAREGEADGGGVGEGAADDGAARGGAATGGAWMIVGAVCAVIPAGPGADSA